MAWQAKSVSKAILNHLEEIQTAHESKIDRSSAALGVGPLYRTVAESLAIDLAATGIEHDTMSTGVRLDNADGYISGSRDWDLVVYQDDVPTVVLEIKLGLNAPRSNLQNILNDILALATSLHLTFNDPAREPFRPQMAAVVILGSRGRNASPRQQPMSPSEPEPHIRRAGEALSRMLADHLLDAACLLTVDLEQQLIAEPFQNLSFDSFVSSLQGHQTLQTGSRTSTAAVAASLGRAFSRGRDVDDVVSGLVSTPEGFSAAEAAIIRSRRRLIAELQSLALDSRTTETKMQAAIGSNYWIFGGQYIGIVSRRTLLPLDQYDIPLVCADGGLEIVELKGPEAGLVRDHRNHLIVSNDVHTAVSQCLNYLRSLDELGASLATYYQNELGIKLDLQRARGTVVIGHPERPTSRGVSRERIDQTIRSYNVHLSRITVITYADLLDSAERALQFLAEEESALAGEPTT